MSDQKKIKALFVSLLNIGVQVKTTSKFKAAYARAAEIAARYNADNVWQAALFHVFLDEDVTKFIITPIKTAQANNKAAQKSAIKRLLTQNGFYEPWFKRILASMYVSVKDNRGGTRVGAGRPVEIGTSLVSLTLDDVTIEHLKIKGNGNMSAGVRLLCEEDKRK